METEELKKIGEMAKIIDIFLEKLTKINAYYDIGLTTKNERDCQKVSEYLNTHGQLKQIVKIG